MVQAKGIPSSSFRAYLGSKAAMLQKNPSWSLHKALKIFWKSFGFMTEIWNNSAEALYQSAQTPIFYGGCLFPNVALLSSTMQVWPISAASIFLKFAPICQKVPLHFCVCLIQNLNPWLRQTTAWTNPQSWDLSEIGTSFCMRFINSAYFGARWTLWSCRAT